LGNQTHGVEVWRWSWHLTDKKWSSSLSWLYIKWSQSSLKIFLSLLVNDLPFSGIKLITLRYKVNLFLRLTKRNWLVILDMASQMKSECVLRQFYFPINFYKNEKKSFSKFKKIIKRLTCNGHHNGKVKTWIFLDAFWDNWKSVIFLLVFFKKKKKSPKIKKIYFVRAIGHGHHDDTIETQMCCISSMMLITENFLKFRTWPRKKPTYGFWWNSIYTKCIQVSIP